MKEAAHVMVTKIACLREKFNVLVICGLHNKTLAEHIMLESYAVGAYPHLWVFDEKFYLKHAEILSESTMAFLPTHLRSLLENSNVIIWLSQFGALDKFPVNLRKAIISFWDEVDEATRTKPHLYVNLLSSQCIKYMGINYELCLKTFTNAVNVDYGKIRKIGNAIAAKLYGKKTVHVYDAEGTDLTFSIYKRNVGVEVGTLEDRFSLEKECDVEVPGGEVYVAPIETSANGVLAVKEFRDYKIKNLKLRFSEGKIVSFKAEKGSRIFGDLLDKAEGDKDRIAEFGIGINYGMNPIGYRIYDEKALGTVHIAIGNNVHLGGVNKASIHWDFILYDPNIEVDNVLVMKNGKLQHDK
ncbi:MAG: aminopeptidase [Candidatus Bathyarchaeota archaeon]|nr:aminopeptidase [Candidatus Bathyarchaeota archaeon]